MAQEFASDNSKTGLFSRLKLSNHRGFFSFIFVTLSVIFILVTFSAIQQQQTTQSKAAGINICQRMNCFNIAINNAIGAITDAQKQQCATTPCCKVGTSEVTLLGKQVQVPTCQNDSSQNLKCSSITNFPYGPDVNRSICNGESVTFLGKTISLSRLSDICEWKDNKCGEIGATTTTTGGTTPTPTRTPLEAKCYSYGLGSNGEVNCAAKAAQNNVECKWEGSPTVGRCVPGSVSTTTTPTPTPTIGGGGGDPDSACTSLGGRCLTGQTGRDGKDCKAVIGQAGTGKIQSGLCSGSADRKCCVPNSTGRGTGPTVTCGDFTSQTTCLPADQCTWITKRGTTDTKICQRVCGRIPDQPTCDKRADCNWKNNQCVNKSGSGPSGNVGDVDLNLELAFQGIVTLPKTKTELKVRVKLVDAENREKENDVSTFTADANGIWSGKVTFEDVDLSQKYYILIKGPMHVQKKICSADAADPNPGYYSCQFGNITLTTGVNTFDFSKVKMLVGDLDQNGLVNREDTGPLLSALLLDLDQRKSTEILEKLDLNLDGIVEPKDWSLMLEALKIKYDEE